MNTVLIGGSVVKTPPAMQERWLRFDSWVGKIPCRKKWQPTPIFLPEKSHGQRSLSSYSPWAIKEPRTQLSTHTCILINKTKKFQGLHLIEFVFFFIFTITFLEITGLPSCFYFPSHIKSSICMFFTLRRNPNYFELAVVLQVHEYTTY